MQPFWLGDNVIDYSDEGEKRHNYYRAVGSRCHEGINERSVEAVDSSVIAED